MARRKKLGFKDIFGLTTPSTPLAKSKYKPLPKNAPTRPAGKKPPPPTVVTKSGTRKPVKKRK